jgi:PBSX family phage terminase large subunit
MNLSDALRRLERLEEEQRYQFVRHIKITDKETIIFSEDEDKFYVPNETGKLFTDSDSFVKLIMGPYGSGKSTAAIQSIVRSACEMPNWRDSRRRSRWAIVRNTSGELQSTTLKTWLDWFGELGDITKRQKPILTYEHTFNDGHGVVELELLFLALDRPDDVRKVKSLELTGCYINELSEVPKAVLDHMKGRVGRYPSKSNCPTKYKSQIIADTNPPEEDHWIHRDFEEKQIEGYQIFKQPPGLIKSRDGIWITNTKAENLKHLPDRNYYERLASGQTEDFIKVYCLGQYGTVGTGKQVYPEFNPDLHSVQNLQVIQGEPLILGWDFGLTPACVVMQITPRGQLLVLKEYVANGMGIRSFADSVVIPSIKRDFVYNKIGMSFADPSGSARNEIMEEMSCIGELNSLGIETIGARTNEINPRLSAVRYFLNKMVDGKPGFLIDKRNCPVLYKGFVKDYIYQRLAVVGEERFKDKPLKNHASHPMDALGYACLEIASDNIVKDKVPIKIVDVWNPVMRVF